MEDLNQASLFGDVDEGREKNGAMIKARSGTFTDNMKLPIHRWFRYSAGFSAEWVESLVEEKSPRVVLDPFAGSGTTLLAASAKGVNSFGYESHPFVARIAKAKVSFDYPESELVDAAREVIKLASKLKPADVSDVPDLMLKCYLPDVLLRLYSLRDAYFQVSNSCHEPLSEHLWLAITATLRQCSHVGTAQWQYVLPNKTKSKSVEPYLAFEKKIREMASDIGYMKGKKKLGKAKVYDHDARNVCREIKKGSVDLVITSPPYPNNYDYADSTRLEMTFWGEIRGWGDLQESVRKYIVRSSSQHATAEKLSLDELLSDESIASIRGELSSVCSELATVRLDKGGKKAYHTMVAAYFCDLSRVFSSLRPLCKQGSSMCFVVGDSAPYGVHVPAEQWLGRMALEAGFHNFTFEKLRDRNTKWKNRKHQVPLHEGRLWIEG